MWHVLNAGLARAEAFLRWLSGAVAASLHPGAPHARQQAALGLLGMILDVWEVQVSSFAVVCETCPDLDVRETIQPLMCEQAGDGMPWLSHGSSSCLCRCVQLRHLVYPANMCAGGTCSALLTVNMQSDADNSSRTRKMPKTGRAAESAATALAPERIFAPGFLGESMVQTLLGRLLHLIDRNLPKQHHWAPAWVFDERNFRQHAW